MRDGSDLHLRRLVLMLVGGAYVVALYAAMYALSESVADIFKPETVSSGIHALSRKPYNAIGWRWPGEHGEVSGSLLAHKPRSVATIRLPLRVDVEFHR